MNVEESLAYLSRFNSAVIRLGLDPVTRLLKRLQMPHNNYITMLIGGTNGKGSIAAMSASMLAKGGFRVGLYTSPHLIDVRERIRVNGHLISAEEFAERIEEVRKAITEEVTYFEFLTALAFLHFSKADVDIAVLEVGLGGRLDATSVVKPAVSVISNISVEHREYLGTRLEDIAREKGGIIKEGGTCVTGARQDGVVSVLDAICYERGAQLIRLGKDIRVRTRKDGAFSYQGLERSYRRLFCPLQGRHQLDNAALAIGAMEIIKRTGVSLDDEAISQGIRDTRWEGRLEILSYRPTILVDGAHNPAGASSLRHALTSEYSYDRLILVFGVLMDKDYRSMLRRLAPLAYTIILTKPDTARAALPHNILPIAAMYSRNVEVEDTVEGALNRAEAAALPDDLICITGSLYLVGQVKQKLGSKT